jgi:parallel beta-helix repeat protein
MRKMSSIMHKRIIMTVLCILILSSIFSITSKGEKDTHQTIAIPQVLNSQKTYLTHNPITIITDANFTDYGFPGLGTENDPYRIENYNITTTEERAISIENIDKYFIIQNCFLIAEKYGIYINFINANQIIIANNECSNCRDGILVANGLKVKVSNNTCYNNGNYGITVEDFHDEVLVIDNNCSGNVFGLRVLDSFGVTVSDNICERNELRGITDWKSESSVYQNTCNDNGFSGITSLISYPSLFYNNTCDNNLEYGIHLSGSSSSKVFNNSCFNNGKGIYIKECFHLEIFNNTCFENTDGIYLTDGSWYNLVFENLCYSNTQNGISLTPSRFTSVLNNTIVNNKEYGIYSERSIELVISYNSIQNNENYGIYLASTTNNTLIAYNSFINNNPSNTSQGYDAGKKNKWFDEENKAGNYWSGWDKRGKYSIDGSAESVDKYPLNEQLERVSSLSFLWISFSFLFITLPIFREKKKRKT